MSLSNVRRLLWINEDDVRNDLFFTVKFEHQLVREQDGNRSELLKQIK